MTWLCGTLVVAATGGGLLAVGADTGAGAASSLGRFTTPPLDVDTAHAAVSVMVMYGGGGGGVGDVTLLVLLGAGWDRVTGPRRGRKGMVVSA